MPIIDVVKQLQNSGILPIEVMIWRTEDEYETFLYQGNISEYIDVLQKINIKSVFIEKRIVRKEDFIYYIDEDELLALRKQSKLNIDEEGMVDLVNITPELQKYKKYIGLLMEIRIISVIEGKEFQINIYEDWGSELNILFIRSKNILEDMIEVGMIEAERRKVKRH
jgi:hypothetical protein